MLLRNKNFLILFSGQIVSMIGNNFYLIALPWYVLQLTGSKYDLTLTGVVQTLPGLAGLFIGVLVDRWNKRRTMIVSDFLRGIVALALFSITIFHVVNSRNFMIILFLVPLAELIGTVFYPAQMSLIPKIVPNDQMEKAMAWNQSGSSVAGIAGLFGGGTVLSLLGAPFMFAFNGLSYIVSSVSLFFVRVPESKKVVDAAQQTSFLVEWKFGFRAMFRRSDILRISVLSLVANFALAAIDLTITAWVQGPLHGNGYILGIINGGFMIGATLGGVAVPKLNKALGPYRLLFVASFMIGLCDGTLGLFKSPYWTTGAMFISGLFVAILNATTNTVALRVTPADVQGRVFGALGAASTLSQPLGMLIFGWLMINLNLSIVFSIMGIIVIGGSLLYVRDTIRNAAVPIIETSE